MKRMLAGLLGIVATAFTGTASADSLRIGTGAEPTSVDPHFWTGFPNIQLGMMIFDHLIIPDKRYQMSPGLAVSWKRLDDKTWEFKLRQGVKWHDASPFTADDVIFTFKRAPDAGVKQFAQFVKGRDPVKVDDYTIHIKTPGPDPLVPNNMMGFAIVSKKHGEKATTDDYNAGKGTVGTGPYKFVEWVKGDRLALDDNPDYWGTKPKWDMVIMKPITTGPSRVASLLSGEVDLIDYVPTADIAKLKKDAKVTVSQAPSSRVLFWELDVSRDVSPYVFAADGKPMFPNPLRDWRVRKAISMAIDRQAIVERIMDGNAVVANQLLAREFFGYDPSIKGDAYDPEGAKKLLKDEGYGDFTMVVHGPNDRYDNDAQIVEAVAQMLSRIGITAKVETMSKSAYFTRAEADTPEVSISLGANSSSTGESPNPLQTFCHSRWIGTGYGAASRPRYANSRLDKIIEGSLVTVDDGKRLKLLHEAMQICVRDAAYIPSHY